MTSDPQRAQALFLAALELSDSAARRKLLERECAGDESLRQRVEALLCAHDATGGFDVEPSGQAFQATIDAPLSMHPGTLVAGRYKLLEPIGEGGMGTVWLAEQKEPVKRKVAIKLVKAGMDSRQVLARFEAERQALALMDHPNIAKVFDGGMTEQGRPFFVMEYVKGVPLTEYCDQARLSLKERLQLFMPVCQAVQHAHQKGIIHRDLKPSNILICLYDGSPVPKVIDFGLAKAMHHSLTDQSLYTAHGMMVGTPLYMSPEQAEHNNLDVDTRTDIYSLGVILYELLTGTTPLERQQMKQAAYNEILRLIKEVEPPKPSTRLSGSASLPSIAAQRSIDPRQLRKSLAGDLDWIVMKALDKERSRRYETANGLSRDIERFLHDEAVDACPPSSAYRLKKFIHRNRPQVIAASLVLLALLGGVVGTSVGLYQANMARNAEAWQRELAEAREREANDERAKAVSAAEQERQAKEREAQRAEGERLAKLAAETAQKQAEQAAAKEKAANAQAQKRLAQVEKGNEILASIFNDLDIYQVKQGSEPLETVLAERLVKAAGQLENESVGDPIAVAALQIRLGDSLLSLGKNQEAVKLLEKARQTCMPLLGSEHEYLALRAMNSLSVAYERSMDYARALPLSEELLKLTKVKHGVKHPNTLAVMNSLAFIYNSCGKSSEAIPIYEDVLEIQRAISGEKDKATLISMTNLGGAYKNARKLDLAQPLLEKTLGLMQENLGAAHSFTLNCATHLGEVYMALGRADLGVPLLEETVELSKKHQGSAHPDTLARISALATAYQGSGKLDQAVTLFEEALEAEKATLGPESPQTIITMHNLAVAYNRDGNRAKAIALLEQALPLLRKKLGLDNSNTLITMGALAALYKDTGQFELALSLYEEHLKLRKARREADHPDTIASMQGLAEVYKGLRKFELAVPLFEETLQLRKAQGGSNDVATHFCMEDLGFCYYSIRRYDKSIPLFEELLLSAEKKVGRKHEFTLKQIGNLGSNYVSAGRLAEGIPLLEENYLVSKTLSIQSPYGSSLLVAYDQAGKTAEAMKLAAELLSDSRKELPKDSTELSNVLAACGDRLLKVKEYVEAEPLLREALVIREKTQPDAWNTFNTQSLLGGALLRQKKYADAEPLLVKGYEGMKAREKTIPMGGEIRIPDALGRLVELYTAWHATEPDKGYDAKAAEWEKKLDEHNTAGEKATPPVTPEK